MVQYTKTGLFLREDSNLGLLVYSPYTGLFFSCLEKGGSKKKLTQWLKGDIEDAPSDNYAKSIGAGWHVPLYDAQYPRQHILSDSDIPLRIHKPEYPILINWLITGHCNCNCMYCYSSDVMTGMAREQNLNQVKQIIHNILSYKPLAVVLTGGDPLISPHLHIAVELLSKKTGVIVDTNGMGVTERHINTFKKHDAFVRVSLDSESPKLNNELRPANDVGSCSLDAALTCINMCQRKRVRIGVQTVVSKRNISDIQSLGEKLFRLGITSWRLQLLANHSCFIGYEKLKPKEDRFYGNILKDISQKNRSGWDEVMSIQVVDNNIPNAVILVTPDGGFYTEIGKVGKVPIDNKNVNKPTIRALREGVLNLDAHTNRYLNI
jgi:MoaA/NifB/PqqE/SkfB family radical SAM enzyme